MMDELAKSSQGDIQRAVPPQYCPYCGSQLHPAFYFCLACATPYKNIERVVAPARPKELTDGELIAKKAPNVAPLFWTYLSVIVGTAVVCYFLFAEDRPDLSLVFQSTALLVTTCVFGAIHWKSLAAQFKRIGFLHPSAWLGLLALVPLLAVNYVYHGWLVQEMGAEDSSPLSRLRETGLSEPALIVFFCVLPAIDEEISFRGLLQHWLHVAVRPLIALVLASALFTALHFSIVSAPYLFAVGMLLGWVKFKSQSLYPAMLIHGIHNFVVIEFF